MQQVLFLWCLPRVPWWSMLDVQGYMDYAKKQHIGHQLYKRKSPSLSLVCATKPWYLRAKPSEPSKCISKQRWNRGVHAQRGHNASDGNRPLVGNRSRLRGRFLKQGTPYKPIQSALKHVPARRGRGCITIISGFARASTEWSTR